MEEQAQALEVHDQQIKAKKSDGKHRQGDDKRQQIVLQLDPSSSGREPAGLYKNHQKNASTQIAVTVNTAGPAQASRFGVCLSLLLMAASSTRD